MDKPWKRTERKVAESLGGERVPITGRQRGDVPDVKHEWLSIEVKHREKIPQWLRTAVAQALAARKSVSYLPIVVLHQENTRHDADLVVMTLKHFKEWFVGEDDE